ncbi:MAG: NAD(P)-dependent oxidoreductase [Oligoflexia bacterium]|nr:NAD(P)-dependent oxidoreductase [Oligoflexia bacterium]
MQATIGFIGLGIMGASMAQNLLKRGHSLAVYNRSHAKAAALREFGAQVYESAAELARRVNVLMINTSDAKSIEDVLWGPVGVASNLKRGALVIIFSTIAPGEARNISTKLEAQGVRCLDAPVSGGDVGARNATLSIMVGGSRNDFNEARSLLECVGKRIEYMGPSGAGELMKAVNQVGVALSVAAMAESLALAHASGLDTSQSLDVLNAGAARSWSLENYGPRALAGDFKPGFTASHMLKDLRFVLEEARSLDLRLPCVELVTSLYETLCAGPGANLGNHALLKLYGTTNSSK